MNMNELVMLHNKTTTHHQSEEVVLRPGFTVVAITSAKKTPNKDAFNITDIFNESSMFLSFNF